MIDITAERLAGVRTALDAAGLDGLVVYADGAGESAGGVRYLAGWMPLTSEAVLIVPVAGEAVLVSADKNRARAFAQVVSDGIRVVKTKNLVDSVRVELDTAFTAEASVGLVGGFDLTVAKDRSIRELLGAYTVTRGDALLSAERSHRGDYEAKKHRASTRVSDAMVQHAMRLGGVAGITGADIMAEVENLGRRLGADKAGCWLALGTTPAETYFELFELATSIEPGDRLQIGTTVLVDGYFSQVLRIGVLGTPSAPLVEMAESIADLQDAALAEMTPGEPVHRIGDVLEAGIDRLSPWARADDPFRFQSCHAMGNSYSEPWSAPFLDADRDRTQDHRSPAIETGQTYEIHPNFTSKDLGHVCAGDVALVTETGGVWISETPRGILRLG